MNRQTKKVVKNTILVFVLVVIATVLINVDSKNPYLEQFSRSFVIGIYYFLIAYWGLAIVRRIMDSEIRKYLMFSAGAMLFWFFIRSVKWYLAIDPFWERLCWYAYYIPQLLLVYFTFMTVEVIVEKNKIVNINRSIAMGLTTIFLITLVMTNDLHNLVFNVRDGKPYSHSAGYYSVALWMVIIIVLSVIRLCTKKDGKRLDRRVFAPLSVVLTGVMFCIIVFIKEWKGMTVYLEYTAGFSIFTISFWESIILTGLIPSNGEYEWCFNHSGVKARILDSRGRVIYESIEARNLTQSEIYELSKDGLIKSGENTELVLAPIRGGSVVWERDVKSINESIRALSEATEYVREATESLGESIRIEKKQEAIAARTRLYDLTFNRIEDRLLYLKELIKKARGDDAETLKKRLKLIDIVGVYIKRRSNLILLSEQTLEDFTDELRLCFKESFDNLNDFGLEADFMFSSVSNLNYEMADVLFTLYESMVEEHLDTLKEITAIIKGFNDKVILTVNVKNKEEAFYQEYKDIVSAVNGISVESEQDGKEFTVSFSCERRKE